MKKLIIIIACILLSIQIFTINMVITEIKNIPVIEVVEFVPQNQAKGISIKLANAIKKVETGGKYTPKGLLESMVHINFYLLLSTGCLNNILGRWYK